MAKLSFNWNNLQDMLKDLQGVSAGHVTLSESQKFVMRKAVESFTVRFMSSVLDKHVPCDEVVAQAELEVDPIVLEIVNQSPIIFSISKKEKYEVDPSAIQAAGFKNQTDMFNSLAGSSDILYEGLFKKKVTVFFDTKKAEKIYKTKGAGAEFIKVSESTTLNTSVKKGGK